MRTYVDGRAATAIVTVAVKVAVQLEPGLWVVTEDDARMYSVTTVNAVLDADGVPHLTWPRGVRRNPGGQWSSKEYLLHRALPRHHPREAWKAVPQAVRSLIEDAYLLELDRLPQTVGAST